MKTTLFEVNGAFNKAYSRGGLSRKKKEFLGLMSLEFTR